MQLHWSSAFPLYGGLVWGCRMVHSIAPATSTTGLSPLLPPMCIRNSPNPTLPILANSYGWPCIQWLYHGALGEVFHQCAGAQVCVHKDTTQKCGVLAEVVYVHWQSNNKSPGLMLCMKAHAVWGEDPGHAGE